MSYKTVNKLSSKATDASFLKFKNWEDYKNYTPDFHELKVSDKIAIKGCKETWIVANNALYPTKISRNVYLKPTITINDESGFYAAILREDIETIFESEEDEMIFKSGGQFSLF